MEITHTEEIAKEIPPENNDKVVHADHLMERRDYICTALLSYMFASELLKVYCTGLIKGRMKWDSCQHCNPDRKWRTCSLLPHLVWIATP